MQLLLLMKTEKLKLDENRIRKTVSFESVNVDSDFFFCPTHATRRKTSFSVS